jgi:hypothetical protein
MCLFSMNRPLPLVWQNSFYDYSPTLLCCCGRFVEQKLVLSSSFRCDKIHNCLRYDFSHTLLWYSSQTWMFNKPTSEAKLTLPIKSDLYLIYTRVRFCIKIALYKKKEKMILFWKREIGLWNRTCKQTFRCSTTPPSEASLLNKCSYLTRTLGAIKFTIVTAIILVTLCSAT